MFAFAISAPLPPPRTRPPSNRLPRACTPPPAPARFNWRDQWYPLALTANLPRTPTRIVLLSTPLVAWPAGATWSVLRDRCPHRLAALSEGVRTLLSLTPARTRTS